MSQVHAYFEPIVNRQRTKNRIACVVMLIVSGIALAWGLSDPTASSASRMVALGGIAIPVALGILVWNFLPSRGLAALADPSRIVWYYGVRKSGHVSAVMVGFEDGKLHRFTLPLISLKEGFSQEAFQHLKAAAPNATTGHSEETREAFNANPASLRG